MKQIRKFLLAATGVLLLLHAVFPHLHSDKSKDVNQVEIHNQICHQNSLLLYEVFSHNHSSSNSPDVFLSVKPEKVSHQHSEDIFAESIGVFGCNYIIVNGVKPNSIRPPNDRFLSSTSIRPPPFS